MARGTSQVDKTALGEEDDVVTILHGKAVYLWLDVGNTGSVSLEPGNIDFDIEMANVANYCVVTHHREMCSSDDVSATSGGDENLGKRSSFLHCGDLVAGYGSLKGVDGIDFCDNNASTHALKSLSTTLADIAETSNNGNFASNHHVGGTLDAIDKRLSATVQVVELRLGHGVIDIDSRYEELALFEHSVEVVDTSGSLFRHSKAALQHLRVLLVDEGSQVTAIIKDEVQRLSILESGELLLETPVVFLLCLTLPGKAVQC